MKLSLNRKQALWGFAFLTIPLLYFVFIFVLPMIDAFRFSVLEYNTLSAERPFVGLENYRSMFSDDLFWTALRNTIKFAVVRAPVVLVISLVTALLFQNLTRFRNGLRTILMLPFMTSLVAMAWLWNFLYSRTGPITIVLNKLDIFSQPQLLLSPKTAIYAVIAVTVWGSIGYYTLLFTVGLDAIPEELYDAAKVDGASALQTFRHVTLPLLNPTIVLLSIIAVTASLKNFDVVRNMTGTGRPLNSVLTLPLMIYMEAFTRLNMGRAAALTTVFFVMILIITFIQLKVITREVEY